MSSFFSEKYIDLEPYVPGEQPQDMQYVKLNTNESPFPPSPSALYYASEMSRPANLYSDPDCTQLRSLIADTFGVSPGNVICGNGSDEILNFAFMAFCDPKHPAVFPDITYGFYPVFAKLNNAMYREIPLEPDLSIDPARYIDSGMTIFIANPNAPTGKLLSPIQIEGILATNPQNVVVIDEAYIDFGGISCVPLIKQYRNLLVVQTFSKSRSMAGARLGFAIGNEELIRDLNTIRYSTNPYNVNSYTAALGAGTLMDAEYTKANCATIMKNRKLLTKGLRDMGFEVLDSAANFVFAKHSLISGLEVYEKLKENGVLVRHFSKDRIKDYNRITVGTAEQTDELLGAIKRIWRIR